VGDPVSAFVCTVGRTSDRSWSPDAEDGQPCEEAVLCEFPSDYHRPGGSIRAWVLMFESGDGFLAWVEREGEVVLKPGRHGSPAWQSEGPAKPITVTPKWHVEIYDDYRE
jgi:hypothetical protein